MGRWTRQRGPRGRCRGVIVTADGCDARKFRRTRAGPELTRARNERASHHVAYARPRGFIPARGTRSRAIYLLVFLAAGFFAGAFFAATFFAGAVFFVTGFFAGGELGGSSSSTST